jgi:hypothetical protein
MLPRTRAIRSKIAEQICVDLAGPLLQEMIESAVRAKEYLHCSEPRVRLAALHILRHYFEPTPDFARRCESLAFNDPNDDVRAVAITFLSACYRETWDTRVGSLVAKVVCDTEESVTVRRSAYSSLFILRGIPTVADLVAEFRFPEDVDWSFVNSILTQVDVPTEMERFAMQHPRIPHDLLHRFASYRQKEQKEKNDV